MRKFTRPKPSTLAQTASKAGLSQALLRAIQEGSAKPTAEEAEKIAWSKRVPGGSALLSPCGGYRYTLTRDIDLPAPSARKCLFIMLNPSTADGLTDDPTIRRCKAFCQSWSCCQLTVVNLFAMRSTDPKLLLAALEPSGPDNYRHLSEQLNAHNGHLVVAAWGANPASRRALIMQVLVSRFNPLCLGETATGTPSHPLYLPKDAQLRAWTLPKKGNP